MAKYVEKTEADLHWNEIRREIEMRINIMAANWKDRKKNEILPAVQDRFEMELNDGRLLSLTPGSGEAEKVIKEILEDVLSVSPDA